MASELRDDVRESEYSIGVTARLTGVSADKLRVWERRYGFPVPRRTSSGVRVYSELDVGRLVLIRRAMDAGCRAGEAVQMSREELLALLGRAEERESNVVRLPPPELETVISRLASEDVDFVRTALSDAADSLGAERFATEYAAELVDRVGDGWESGELAVRHEHLFSQLLTARVHQLLSEIEPETGPTLLLATLPGEHHGLGLGLVSLVAAAHGVRPRVVGVDTPVAEIVEAARGLRVQAVGLSVAAGYDVERARGSIAELLEQLPRYSALWVGGAQAPALRFADSRYAVISSWTTLAGLLDLLRAQY